ncbi:MAG: glycosyltransferase family 39 protein [Lentisphaerae bacterium]|nr:glycosyltransferase family 39 protein [Lentisphaerota bacterium]
MKTPASTLIRDGLILTAVWGSVSLLGYWKLPVSRAQEGRVIVSAREAIRDGHWLIPTLNGRVRLQKPPLMTWLVAGSCRLFGAVSETTARAPSLLFALATAFLLYAFARELQGDRLALVPPLVMLTSFQFIRHSRLAEIDIALLFWTVLSLFLWRRAATTARSPRVWYALGFIVCAIAVNFKGPAGLAIPLCAQGAYLLLARKPGEFRRWLNPLPLLLCAVLSAAWYAFACLETGDKGGAIFAGEVSNTFIKGNDHGRSALYYFYTLFQCFAPWTLFMYLAVAVMLWRFRNHPENHFTLAWLATTFVLLSLTPNKQPHYSLLLLPPMALAAGRLAQIASGPWQRPGLVKGVTAGLTLLMIAGTVAGTFFFHSTLYPKVDRQKNLIAAMQKASLLEGRLFTFAFEDPALVFHADRFIPMLNSADALARQRRERDPFRVIFKGSSADPFPDGTTELTAGQDDMPFTVKRFEP